MEKKNTKKMLLTFGLFALLGLQMSWRGNQSGSGEFAQVDPCASTEGKEPRNCIEAVDMSVDSADDKSKIKYKVKFYAEDTQTKTVTESGKVVQGKIKAVVEAVGPCEGGCGNYELVGTMKAGDTAALSEFTSTLKKQIEKNQKAKADEDKKKKDEEKKEAKKKPTLVSQDELKSCKEYSSRDQKMDQLTCLMDLFRSKMEETDDKDKEKWSAAEMKSFFSSHISTLLSDRMNRYASEDSDAAEEGREARQMAVDLYNDLIGTRGESVRKLIAPLIDRSNRAEATRLAKFYKDAKNDPEQLAEFNRQREVFLHDQQEMRKSVYDGTQDYMSLSGHLAGSKEYFADRARAQTAFKQFENGVSLPGLNLLNRLTLEGFSTPGNIYSSRSNQGLLRKGSVGLFNSSTAGGQNLRSFNLGSYGLNTSLTTGGDAFRMSNAVSRPLTGLSEFMSKSTTTTSGQATRGGSR